MICAEKVLESVQAGGWARFPMGDLDTLNVYDRETVIISLIELDALSSGMTDCEPLQMGERVNAFLESFNSDLRVHIYAMVSGSTEYYSLCTWLQEDNYFSIGFNAFSKWDTSDLSHFLDKFMRSLQLVEETELVMEFSNQEGQVLFNKFLTFCQNSIQNI